MQALFEAVLVELSGEQRPERAEHVRVRTCAEHVACCAVEPESAFVPFLDQRQTETAAKPLNQNPAPSKCFRHARKVARKDVRVNVPRIHGTAYRPPSDLRAHWAPSIWRGRLAGLPRRYSPPQTSYTDRNAHPQQDHLDTHATGQLRVRGEPVYLSGTFRGPMAKNQISLEAVHHVAKLAALALSPAEELRLQANLDVILDHMAELAELDVSAVEPTFHAVPIQRRAASRPGRAVAAARRTPGRSARPRGWRFRGTQSSRRGQLGMTDWAKASVTDIADAVGAGRVSAVEVARAMLDRIVALDSRTQAYLSVDREGALAAAAQVDRSCASGGGALPLAGVPIAVKDNLCTRGVRTTCASRILEGYIPPYDAHVVEQLRAAGAVIIGKLNLDEFAMGSSTENSAFFPTRNPWDETRTPGGSSGGAAAATALSLTAAALGSDTGGSVRQPASYCGITAIKPSYGRVSRYGLVAFASSLDQVGPLARNMRDAARLLGVISGHDARDATSVSRPVPDYEAECGQPVRGLRVGVVRGALERGCESSVQSAFARALERFAALGCELVDVELPHQKYAISVYYIVVAAEASSNLARFDGMRYGLRVAGEDLRDSYAKTRAAGFGTEVKRRVMLGTYVLSAGLLRRVLSQGPEGADLDQAGLRARFRALRCAAHADGADRCISLGREARGSALHVHAGHLHAATQLGRHRRGERAVRTVGRGFAARAADLRACL